MRIEGTIMEVMESWPVQLSVRSGGRIFHVELLDETTVKRRSDVAEQSDLRPNIGVAVFGTARRGVKDALIANRIEILD